MPTSATKNSRDIIAYALLAVAALYFIGVLSLLLKSSGGQFSGIGFAEKSALFGAGFTAAVPVLSLVAAVVLVTRLGEPSANARLVVLAALGIAGLDLLFAVITFFAQLGASSLVGAFSGVQGAGKIIGFVVGLAHLLFVAAALFYVLTELQRLPAPARAASQWGADRGYAQYGGQGAQPPWGQPDQGYQPGSQQPWGPAGQQAWGQTDPGGAQTWGQADQGGAQTGAGRPGRGAGLGPNRPGRCANLGAGRPGRRAGVGSAGVVVRLDLRGPGSGVVGPAGGAARCPRRKPGSGVAAAGCAGRE